MMIFDHFNTLLNVDSCFIYTELWDSGISVNFRRNKFELISLNESAFNINSRKYNSWESKWNDKFSAATNS